MNSEIMPCAPPEGIALQRCSTYSNGTSTLFCSCVECQQMFAFKSICRVLQFFSFSCRALFFPFDCHCIPCMQARVATVRMNTTASTTTAQQKHLAGATAYVVVAFILFSSAYFSTWLMLWTAKHNTRLFWYLCLDKSPNAGATSPNNKRQQQRNSKATQYQNARIKEN